MVSMITWTDDVSKERRIVADLLHLVQHCWLSAERFLINGRPAMSTQIGKLFIPFTMPHNDVTKPWYMQPRPINPLWLH